MAYRKELLDFTLAISIFTSGYAFGYFSRKGSFPLRNVPFNR